VRLSNDQDVAYWRLVIATGAIPFVPDVPGLADHAVTMWSVQDAQDLQQRGERAFYRAAKLADRGARRRELSFVVVGGGATGVEIVGTMAQMLPKRLLDQGLHPADLSVTLIEGRPQILYDLPEKQRHRARRRLERLGANVIVEELVTQVDEGQVVLSSGRVLDASVLVWCGGARADPATTTWGFATDNAGRVLADSDLKVEGHDDIYVIGDVASVRNPRDNSVLPMLAQVAIQEGPCVARNIAREANGLPAEPFVPHLRGEFVSVGPSWGVGWMYGMNLTGLPAIVMKRITYIKYWLQVGGVALAWKRTREMLAMQR
jgi:NADH dehydrogenase